MAEQDNEEEITYLLQLLSKDQQIPEDLQDRMDLLRKIDNTAENNTMDLVKFLKHIRDQLDRDRTLPNLHIEKLLSIQIFKNKKKLDFSTEIQNDLKDIFAILLMQNPEKYSTKEVIVDSLENAILSKYINKYILSAYQQVIKNKQCQANNASKILDALAELLKDENSEKFQVELIACIALVSECMEILKVDALRNNLNDKNPLVRWWSFRGLRAAHARGIRTLEFDDFCHRISDRLEQITSTQVRPDLDLFETFTATKYRADITICNKPQDQWIRELLIYDLAERLPMSQVDKLSFHKTWLEIEKHEKFCPNKSNILLKLIHHFYCNNPVSFDQFFDTIKTLTKFDFENIRKILSNSKNPGLGLRKEYLKDLIFERLLNKDVNIMYIGNLALDMISRFDVYFSEKLLCSIQEIDNLKDFEEILNLAHKTKIQMSDINVKDNTLSKLKRSLEIKFLTNQYERTDHLELSTILNSLLDKNWTFEQLKLIFSSLSISDSHNKAVKRQYSVDVLEILSQYEICPTKENQEKILLALKKPPKDWLREMNIIAIDNNFLEKVRDKETSELVDELRSNNSDKQHVDRLIERNLLDLIEKIKKSDTVSQVLINVKGDTFDRNYISEWTKEQIRKWASEVKTNLHPYTNTDDFIKEALVVIKRANFLDSDFHLTDGQILSCLVALYPDSVKGRLLQVATGEGKSTIISVLAVIHALKGENVDIITSSPVLAERDAKEKAKFYSMFNLECSDNNDKSIYSAGPKSCYKKPIVYGEAAQFQFDTLRTEYAQLNTLGGRKHGVVIVDEVDSMLIDDASKIARLATTISGMDQLQIIYHLLWHELVSVLDRIITFNGKTYLFHGKISFEQEKIILEAANEQEEILTISDLKTYLESTSNISHIGTSIPENNDSSGFVKNHLEDYIKKVIKKQIEIPTNFAKFVDTQIPKWIDNAITAYNYQKNVHYIVQEGLIKPVDYYSTGIVQNFSSWSDGLHQFLQIKHNLKMTSETFTTNFLSNRGYFTRYGSNLFGLTGTLGSENAKQVLADTYNVDIVIIPSSRPKQYRSLPDTLATNETEWLKKICRSAINESNKDRGTLIISETIEHSMLIAENLRHDYRSGAIKLYTMNSMNQEHNVARVNPGEIVIATNLAGRGTDIKTDEIEKNGGLHVIVTFMPPNKRVEEQAFGRTARQGKRGTGQRILNMKHLIDFEKSDSQNFSAIRDRIEAKMLNDFKKHELEIIILKDNLFVKFCSLLNEIRNKIRKKYNLSTKLKNQVKSVFTNMTPSVFESNILLAVEEQWAMFLREIDNKQGSIDKRQIYEKYDKFHEQVIKDFYDDCIIKNPYYHIVIANNLVINDSSLNSKYDEAMRHFDRAIELDPKHCAAAFAGKGWLLLKGKERFIRSNKQGLDYKNAAIEEFNKALELLSKEMGILQTMHTVLQQRCFKMYTALSKQIMQKINILGNYFNSLENAIHVIEKSQRSIIIREISRFSNSAQNNGILVEIITHDGIEKESGKQCDIYLIPPDQVHHHRAAIENCEEVAVTRENENEFKIIYKQREKNELAEWVVDNEELSACLLSLYYGEETILDRNKHWKLCTLIYEKIKWLDDHIQKNSIMPLKNLTDGKEYEVTFNDLTVRQDCGTIDQAIETIKQAVAKNERNNEILSSSYNNISVSITQINAKSLKEFFNPNIEIKEVTKQIALTHLKDKTSFFHRHLLPENFSPDSYQIDLEIFEENKPPKKELGLQARNAIKSIQQQIDNDVFYNLTFISANKISKVLQEQVLSNSNQNVEFIELNAEQIKEKLTTIEHKSINLEIQDRKEILLEVISLLQEDVDVCYDREEQRNNRHVKNVVRKNTAKTEIKRIEDTHMTIKLIKIDKSTVEDVIQQCPNAKFNINFININFKSLLKGLNAEMVSIEFENLKKNLAEALITQIRKQKLDFSLTFKNLTKDQAQKLVKLAPKQENIEIKKVKTLSELFTKESVPHIEISEFYGRGIKYLLEINEKSFRPWRSIAVVAMLAAVQMTVGGVLLATGFGGTIGMTLLAEGLADLAFAARAGYSRKFSWSDYGKHKAISLLISATTMGYSALKNVAKGTQNIVKEIGKEAIEETTTQILTNAADVGQQIVTGGGQIFKTITLHSMGKMLGENALVIVNKGISISSSCILDQLKPKISASIQNKVNCKFCVPKLLKLLRKMYALDLINKQDQLGKEINKILAQIVNPEYRPSQKAWASIDNLLKALLTSKIADSSVAIGIKIIGILNSISEINILIETIRDQLEMKLSKIDRETLSMKHILVRYCKVKEEETEKIIALLQKQDIIDEQCILDQNGSLDSQVFTEKLNHCDFDNMNKYKKETVDFLKLLHASMLGIEFNDLSENVKLMSDMITESTIKTIDSHLTLC